MEEVPSTATSVRNAALEHFDSVADERNSGFSIDKPIGVDAVSTAAAHNEFTCPADVDNDGVCDDEDSCIDTTACNFDANPSVACEYTSCAGCKSPLACNYDADASIQDNGTCQFVPEGDNCAICDWAQNGLSNPSNGTGQLLMRDDDGDGICNGADNCSNTEACNYADPANVGCVLKVQYYHDDDGDGIGEYLLGSYCTGEEPGNSTTNAGPDNCTDVLKCNYNLPTNGTCEDDLDDDDLCDGSDNCFDHKAPNFDHTKWNNESCCEDDDNNGVCDDRQIFGCMDSLACNYLVVANLDDGECYFTGTETAQSDNSTSEYQVTQTEDFQCDSCALKGDTITIANSIVTALGLDSAVYFIGEYYSNDEDNDEICDEMEQVGCDDPTACNYRKDESMVDFPQATDAYGNPATDEDGNAIYVTESCYLDEDLGYGVTPQEVQCTNYCKYWDDCGQCGGSGIDEDGDDVCDNADDCTNPLACNYTANPTAPCQFYTECDDCADGVDNDNDGYIDGNDADSDDDGVCDDEDDCIDTNACNFSANPTAACMYKTECDICAAGTDGDGDGYIDGNNDDADDDGLCDDLDNCADPTACNFDVRLYPANDTCFVDTDGDDVCDIHEVVGCKDSTACNYHVDATDDDPSLCVFASSACETCSGSGTDGSGFVLLQDADGDGICDDADLCSDVTACNYNASPTAACGIDADGNGTCDNAETEGCKNPDACNYNVNATLDDGSCEFATNCEICSGATDGTGTVISKDMDFDGVCDDDDNCDDTTACNYIAATSLNATCTYATAGYNCQGDCLEDADNDGICEYNGADLCSDITACNYDDPNNVACLYFDSCGKCEASAPGQLGYDPTVYCDCELNKEDVMGYCGGNCEADVDNDGICDNVDPCLIPGQVPDECGVCGGSGANYECGCFDLPPEGCSCETDGTVTYPALGEDCNGQCLYGFTLVDGDTICNFFDDAQITEMVNPIIEYRTGSSAVRDVNLLEFEEWIQQIDTLHQRMAVNLDDGSVTGASQRLTIEEEILDKGNLTVVGESKLSGAVQMDSNVVILGNLVVEQNLTVKGTTFSRGGIETSSMNMSGDLAVGGATVIDSTLEVFQTTRLHDSLSLLAPLLVGADHVFTVDNSGNTHINGKVTIMDTLIATSNKGAFLGDLVARATSVTTLDATGVATLNDSLEVHGDTELKGDLAVEENTTLSGSLDVSGASTMTALATTGISNSGVLSSNSIENATEVLTNTLEVESSARMQSLDVSESTQLFGQMTVQSADTTLLFGVTPGANSGALGLVSLPGDLKIYSSSTAHSDAPGAPEISLMSSGTMTATGKVTAKNLETTSATTLSSIAGELRVDKKASLLDGLDVEVGGSAALRVRRTNGTIEMHNLVNFENDLTVTGGRSVTMGTSSSNTSLTVHGATEVGSLTVNSTTSLTGTLTAPDGQFTSALSTNGVARAQQGLVVGHGNSSSTAPPTGYTALFDGSTSGMGTSNGIKIKLNQGPGQVSNDNEFITFESNNGTVAGKIRGRNSSDWDEDIFIKQDSESLQNRAHLTKVIAGVNYGIMLLDFKEFATYIGSSLSKLIPDSWCCSMLLPIGCIIIPIPGIPQVDWADVPIWGGPKVKYKLGAALESKKAYVLSLGTMVQTEIFNQTWKSTLDAALGSDGGISYASGNGDYAEYVPKLNSKDEISPRQIVGIKNGKLSLNTDDVDHYLVVSTAPIVVGNEPQEEVMDDYEVVAFMGQVPVDVLGRVSAGDYILPSGDSDGYGIAVHPDDLTANQLDQIVGVAWQDGDDRYFNTVNVAVGLKDAAHEVELNKVKIEADALEAKMRELRTIVETQQFGGSDVELAYQSEGLPSSLPSIREDKAVAESVSVAAQQVPYRDDFQLPQFHTEQTEAVQATIIGMPNAVASNSEQEAFYAEYEAYFSSVLNPMASLQDMESLVNVYNNQVGTSKIPLVNKASEEFVEKMIALELSKDAIQSLVRSELLGNPDFPAFKNIKRGTSAERQLVNRMHDHVTSMMKKESSIPNGK